VHVHHYHVEQKLHDSCTKQQHYVNLLVNGYKVNSCTFTTVNTFIKQIKNIRTFLNLKYFIVLVTFPLLIPWSRGILEKLIVAKLVKKLPDDCLLGYCSM
jgi:hypothetical protein